MFCLSLIKKKLEIDWKTIDFYEKLEKDTSDLVRMFSIFSCFFMEKKTYPSPKIEFHGTNEKVIENFSKSLSKFS